MRGLTYNQEYRLCIHTQFHLRSGVVIVSTLRRSSAAALWIAAVLTWNFGAVISGLVLLSASGQNGLRATQNRLVGEELKPELGNVYMEVFPLFFFRL